ncbi:hypothetical protein PAP_07150 [Palaeococcus pacificus DY20341]|uniref:DUF3216 domain-containing protein n=1 Tax=Palaeococcus pacificus DY20341 TaxID=1343739 RepID=A0A075LSU1_9EURY|nr:DUF3216 domain-containing protein [Palaeococcus pacificus]AIF69820.1 hypothetical protein PAP_07150 [Palaeococcus pacificus DY20341]
MEVVEEIKKLCHELGEEDVVKRIDSFVALNEELESKKGREFIEASIYGFLEGVLITLKGKISDSQQKVKVEELLNEVRYKRKELDARFKKP